MRIRASAARICGLAALIIGGVPGTAHAIPRGMSLGQMISVARFVAPGSRVAGRMRVMESPDGKYALALTQRGDLRSDRVVDELLIWSNRRISAWLSGHAPRPGPVTVLGRESPEDFYGLGEPYFGVIRDVRWWGAADHILFRSRRKGKRAFGLYDGSLGGGIKLLSRPGQDVKYYSVRGDTVLYEIAATTLKVRRDIAAAENAGPYFVGTGRTLLNLLFPTSAVWGATDKVQVWMWRGGTAVRLPLHSRHWELRDENRHILCLSPTRKAVVMDLPVDYVPRRWSEYRSNGLPTWPRFGAVPAAADSDIWVPHEYVVADLQTGDMGPAVGAPDGASRGFYMPLPGDPPVHGGVSWAPDGRAVLLWNTFVPLRRREATRNGRWGSKVPCLAIMNVEDASVRCVATLARNADKTLVDARWASGAFDRLLVTWRNGKWESRASYCLRTRSVNWMVECGPRLKTHKVHGRRAAAVADLRVLQNLNSPPELVASLGGGKERVLFDPNFELRGVPIGDARTVLISTGTGRGGREVSAGLLLPVDYAPGHRYPMVIQTHGYSPDRFLSSGGMVPFAARAFAAAGMVVMQLPQCRINGSGGRVLTYADQLPCNVRLFHAAIRYAVDRGYVDPARVGIIGFSATCEEVLEALENSRIHIAAAELVSGLLNTYTQFVDGVDLEQGWIDSFLTPKVGESPFTQSGLNAWRSRTPAFSINKIRAPVLIESTGRSDVLGMWEPYAVLRYLRRPVDLIVMHAGTHPLSNPRQQLASMRFGVEWFDYWLEHKRPSSPSEYQRWSHLRTLADAP